MKFMGRTAGYTLLDHKHEWPLGHNRKIKNEIKFLQNCQIRNM